MIDLALMDSLAKENQISLSQEALGKLDRYAELLVDWNTKINLTAITDPEDIVYKHFLDSLIILKYVDIPEGSSLIDIGTGAGFPGLVLKIARPDLQISLLDGTQKRLNVIADIESKLGITTDLLHLRAEEGGRKPEYREQFDFATARAVTSLRNLAELCLPYIKVGGYFLPMKGKDIQEEYQEARKAISLNGGEVKKEIPYTLGGKGDRNLFLIQKTKPTSKRFPRSMAKIKKNPL